MALRRQKSYTHREENTENQKKRFRRNQNNCIVC